MINSRKEYEFNQHTRQKQNLFSSTHLSSLDVFIKTNESLVLSRYDTLHRHEWCGHQHAVNVIWVSCHCNSHCCNYVRNRKMKWLTKLCLVFGHVSANLPATQPNKYVLIVSLGKFKGRIFLKIYWNWWFGKSDTNRNHHINRVRSKYIWKVLKRAYQSNYSNFRGTGKMWKKRDWERDGPIIGPIF